MRIDHRPVLIAACLLALTNAVVCAAGERPARHVTLGQSVDQATLRRYHHTDQGTWLVPAAWLAALDKADGSGRFMENDNLRRLGFLIDSAAPDKLNPYGWPVGFSVSDPKTGIPEAGFTCALCHTGEIDYRGTAIRIEGGQAMIDLPGFVDGMFESFAATAADPIRRARFYLHATMAGYPPEHMHADFTAFAASLAHAGESPTGTKITQLDTGRGRLDAVQGIANQVLATDLMVPANAKDFDAPVNFPYLWDSWRLSWLQYNAFIPRQSTSRNIGEALGTRATMHLVDPRTGALNPEPLRWQTSVQLDNLIWMEKTLQSLRAPTWPADVLGPIDQAKATRGGRLFVAWCAGCHGINQLPDGGWDVTVVPLQQIGTDPGQAKNWAARTYDASKLGLGKESPAFELAAAAVNAVRQQLYAQNHTPAAEQETDVTLEAPCGYKARPLIGVWATPPYLHNGSVRTVFDLLSDTRPAQFRFGSLQYDPVHLGYQEDQDDDSRILDTSIPGNRDTGHWFTDDVSRPGRIGPKLTDADKLSIIEFLKTANYNNYPTEPRAAMAVMPCQDDRNWARHAQNP
jgi:mono/diheme cytochrome c family protein